MNSGCTTYGDGRALNSNASWAATATNESRGTAARTACRVRRPAPVAAAVMATTTDDRGAQWLVRCRCDLGLQ